MFYSKSMYKEVNAHLCDYKMVKFVCKLYYDFYLCCLSDSLLNIIYIIFASIII